MKFTFILLVIFNIRSALLQAIAFAAMTVAPAQAQEEFFRGKQVTILVGYGTGGGYDVYARLLARPLSRLIPGNPAVVVQNMPGAGSLRAINQLYNVAPKDGTTIAMFSASMPLQAILGSNPSVRFDPLKLNWLGSSSSFANDAYLLAIRSDSTRKSIEDLRQDTQTPLVIGSSGPGSNSYDIPIVLRDTTGIRFKMVSGYPGSNDLFLAVERGEVHGRMVNLTGLKLVRPDWLKKGNGYSYAVQFGRKTRSEELPDVPTARELASDATALELIKLTEIPFEMARPFAAPPGVPMDRVKVLQAAFLAAHQDAEFLAEGKKFDIDISPVGGDKILSTLRSVGEAHSKNLDYLRKLYSTETNR